MSFPCRIKFAALLILFALSTQAAQAFTICAEPDNLPMSQQSSHSGFDIDVATLLAKDSGQSLQVKWIAQRDPSFFRSTIGAGVCDAIMDVPSEFHRLTVTKPWYRTGFYFITRKNDGIKLTSFDDKQLADLKIGVPATGLGDTPPAIALTKRSLGANLCPYSIYAPQDMLIALAKKDIDVAILWGPFAGWFADKEKMPLTIAPTPAMDGQIPFTFAISIGVRKGNDALKDKLDAALVKHQGRDSGHS